MKKRESVSVKTSMGLPALRRLKLVGAILLLLCMQVVAQQRNVTGRVTDGAGQGLSNVSVTVRGTTNGTVTNEQGNYTITVPSERSVLVFSYVGFGTVEEMVNNRGTVNISMTSS